MNKYLKALISDKASKKEDKKSPKAYAMALKKGC